MKKPCLPRSSLRLIRRQNHAMILCTPKDVSSTTRRLSSLAQHERGHHPREYYRGNPKINPFSDRQQSDHDACYLQRPRYFYDRSSSSQMNMFGAQQTFRYSSTMTDVVTSEEQKNEIEADQFILDDIEKQSDGTRLVVDDSKNEAISDDSSSGSLMSILSTDESWFVDDDDETTASESSSSSSSPPLPSNDKSNDIQNEKQIQSSKSKKKKKRKKRMKQPSKSNLFPKVPTQQSKANAQLLFDYIAPHVDYETLQMLLTKMKGFESLMEQELEQKKRKSSRRKRKGMSTLTSTTQKDIMEYQTLIGKIDAFFSIDKKKKTRVSKSKNAVYLEEHPWIKSLIAQFFAGAKDSSAVSEVNAKEDLLEGESSKHNENSPLPLNMETLWRNPTYTPNINRKKRNEAVSTLMLAREMCLESPLIWSRNQRRRQKKRKDKVEDGHGRQRRREEHYNKSAQQLKEEAEAIASILSFRLPSKSHDEVLDLFKSYAENVSESLINQTDGSEYDMSLDGDSDSDDEDVENDNDEESKDHVEIMKMLYPNLTRRVGFHVHFIAMELADFFYVELPEQMQLHDEGSSSDLDLSEIPPEPLGRSDARINDSWKQWNTLRDDLVDTFLASQHMYVRLQSAIKKGEKDGKDKGKDDKTSKSKSDDIEESEVEKIMIKYSNDAHKRAEELVAELDRLRTNEDGELVGRSPTEVQKPGRAPKGVNLQYECLLLHDKFGPYSNPETAFAADIDGRDDSTLSKISPEIADQLPDTNRSIFIDNLPIDVTEDELEYLYSRCGCIESVEIFNLRPELDPGELTMSDMRKRRKNNRMSGKKGAAHIKNERSPVYAVIKFEDADGYKSATIDMLRIFGMVIRRQAVKTYPARNMHRLFIEDIPEGYFAMDLEEKLSQVLHPDMYITLNLSQHVNAQPKSCEITFPTYEVSHYAYHQLKELDFGGQTINLHWMKTPANAVAYWTRELSPNR